MAFGRDVSYCGTRVLFQATYRWSAVVQVTLRSDRAVLHIVKIALSKVSNTN